MRVIPWQRGAAWRTETTIAGKTIRLAFRYQARNGFWYMRVLDTSDDVIISGVKMVRNYKLLYRVQDDRLPEGQFVVATQSQEPGRFDFIPAENPDNDDTTPRAYLVFLSPDEAVGFPPDVVDADADADLIWSLVP